MKSETKSRDKVTTLVFDWGDTLMVNNPSYDGPMVDWPEVAPVEGAYQALSALHGHYRLVLASNAQASTAEQIRAALDRVELGQFIDQIYTANEFHSRKPELVFFRGIEQALGEPSHAFLMVGDEYRADVTGPKLAGWRAVWFNQLFDPAAGLPGMHDQEIHHMADLPNTLKHLTLPDLLTCQTWLYEQNHSHSLWQHVQMVAAIAYVLSVWLCAVGEKVDPMLAQRGGLLHDLAKLSPLTKNHPHKDHGHPAAELLFMYNQPALAEIADRHLLGRLLELGSGPRTWEEKLVHYADKLAEGSGLVPLEVRIEALRKRYANYAELIQKSVPALLELQTEIAGALHIPEPELYERLRKTLSGG
jgi:putative hydrolase of the HAD superfamily